jgi:hypothetical protein
MTETKLVKNSTAEHPNPENHEGEKWKAAAEMLRERLIYMAQYWAPSRKTYEYLEKRTGIDASKWKNLFLNRQMPTTEMILSICQHQPGQINWLITGTGSPLSPKMSLMASKEPDKDAWELFASHRKWVKEKKRNLSKFEEGWSTEEVPGGPKDKFKIPKSTVKNEYKKN